MVPTLQATLGVKGHRPMVGTRDCKDVLYVFAVLNLISGVLHANTLESLQAAHRKGGESKTRRMQKALAGHLRHVGRMFLGRGSAGWPKDPAAGLSCGGLTLAAQERCSRRCRRVRIRRALLVHRGLRPAALAWCPSRGLAR